MLGKEGEILAGLELGKRKRKFWRAMGKADARRSETIGGYFRKYGVAAGWLAGLALHMQKLTAGRIFAVQCSAGIPNASSKCNLNAFINPLKSSTLNTFLLRKQHNH